MVSGASNVLIIFKFSHTPQESINCSDGAVRLADGKIPQEGRVEVCYNGVWGSVCSDQFDETDGYVVCKEVSEAGASLAGQWIYNKIALYIYIPYSAHCLY